MALINQVFRLGLSATKTASLLQLKALNVGVKGFRDTMITAITKGSADQAAKGDLDLTVEDQFVATVEFDKTRLGSTAAIGGSM